MASVNLKTTHQIIMLSRVKLVCLLFSSNNLFHFTVDRHSCLLPQIILLAVLAARQSRGTSCSLLWHLYFPL